jgi:putative exosortase-associated protein (TIGR04073 family)
MPFLTVVTLVALFTPGCAGLRDYNAATEYKLGRGLSNTYEVVRMGEMRRSIEQMAVFDSPGAGYTVGAVRGFDHSMARTGLGVWEIATGWLPLEYDPVAKGYSRLWELTPDPVYPESYKPGLISDSLFDTDTYSGFSGGDVAPFIPGSRFKIFDN